MTHLTRQDFEALDRDDPVAAMRAEFMVPEGVIYLDGNSLGAMPRRALGRLNEVISREWAQDLIKSWNTAGWFDMPRRLGDKLAPLIGADAGETVVTDATGINLYKTLAAALEMRPDRSVIIMEGSNFPTNNYVAQGLVQQLGGRHEIRFVEHGDVLDAIDKTVAVVALTHVHYKTGRIHDMATITRAAHAAGALTVWDLCHSAGALPVDLNGANADFAIGCTYKYLNGGPGSPAFIFTAKRHHGTAHQPLTGWWSHAAPFAFERDYQPAGDIRQMLSGTQPIISLAAVESGLDATLEAGIENLRTKSMRMGDLFIRAVNERCGNHGFRLISPENAAERGSQVSFDHDDGYAIMQALIARGVIGDFRAPACMRFGFAPLYLAYTDVWDAVSTLEEIMRDETWRAPEFHKRHAVT